MHPGFRQVVQRFSKISEDETALLFSLFDTSRSLRKKEHLFTEGKVCDELHFLSMGFLRGYYQKDGSEITTNFYFGPTFVGDLSSIRQKTPTRLNIQALDEAEIYSAKFTAIEKLTETHSALLRFFMNFVEHLYLFNYNRQLSFLFDTPLERYQKLFKERPKVIANIPLQHIASYLGINPETLSRIRRKLLEESENN